MAHKPTDVLNTTTKLVTELIEKALVTEKDYQYIQNIEANKTLEKEISEKIKKLIEKETSQ